MNKIENRKSKVKRAEHEIRFFVKEIYKGVLKIDENGRLHRLKDNSKNHKGKVDRIIDAKTINGYMGATITTGKKQHNIKMHRLIWYWHYGELPEDEEINHKDGNKANNKINNLEMITHKENVKHALDNNLMKSNWEHKNSKLTKINYEEIDRLLNANVKQKIIAELLNVHVRTILRTKIKIQKGILEK